MPDWRTYLRERLGPLGLRREREEEILTELADHLEDQCGSDGGKSQLLLGWVKRLEDGTDWTLLAREIRLAEEESMSPTAKTLWVPGVSMLFCSLILLLGITRLVPPATWLDPRAPLLLLTPWLFSYLVFGALGAWWSRRAGGGTAARFFSGTFPLTLHLAVFFLPIIVAVVSAVPRFPEQFQLSFLLRVGLLWVVAPGTALAIGTVPFLRDAANTRLA
jgi:hypothetical protein